MAIRRSKGIVAAGHELTARSAESVLQEGGNAFDAVLAATATACVVEPVFASLGGGGFLMAMTAREPPRLYDFFVQTPHTNRTESELDFQSVLADFGPAQQAFHIGRGAVAVPGIVRGLFEVHRDLGSMPMREIFAPAVQCASEGVRVNGFHAYVFRVVKPMYTASPDVVAIFGSQNETGQLVQEGEVLRQSKLADTLECLAIEGDDLFYRGEIAKLIAQDMADQGLLTLRDLADYQVEKRHPLIVDYRGARLLINPPPSSGGLLVAFALSVLSATAPSANGFGSVDHLEQLAHVMDMTSQARLDTHTDQTAPDSDLHPILDPKYLAIYKNKLAGRIRSRRGTTHISVIDGEHNIASLSLSNGEGSGYVIPDTGIVLNNMLGEEDLNPAGFHCWPEGERMTSMMAPTIGLFPGGQRIALGSGGSNRLRTAILQVLVNLIDFDMHVEQAVNAPRIHYEDGLLSIEGGFDEQHIRTVLEAYPDHQVWEERNLFFGGVHTVVSDGKGFSGAGDPRRSGVCTPCGG